MLTQLSTVKARLAITVADYDALLTDAIDAVSTRFDKETNRTLARTANATFEFCAADLEISPPCYPIEAVTKFETKTSEANGWSEQTGTDYLIRRSCIISLSSPLNSQLSTINYQLALACVTYTGGYVLPGTSPGPGQTALPSDLEQAAVEQVAYWFQNRDALGLTRLWPSGGTYKQFLALDLLRNVQTVLKRYTRMSI